MIKVTRINDSEIVINSDLIEFIESSPDTIISLTDGKKIIVRETPDEVIRKVVVFRRMTVGFDKPTDQNIKC
jgi:flagellar protein FlbD